MLENICKEDAKLLVQKITAYQSDSPERIFEKHICLSGVQRFSTPSYASWEVTAACNLRCKHCCFAGQDYNPLVDISSERALQLAQELVDINVLKVMLTGGEPLLRQDIFDIIAILKSANIIVELTTNALLINQQNAKLLQKLFNPLCDYVQVSLDGAIAETHEYTRGKGTFEKTIDGIKLLLANGVNVTINSVITNKNLYEMCALYKLANELGVSKITFTRVFSMYNDDILPDNNELLKETIKLLKLENEKTKIDLRMFTIPELAASKSFYTKDIKEMLSLGIAPDNFEFSCHMWDKIHVRKDGEVFLCLHASNQNVGSLGNVSTKSLEDVLANRDGNILFQKRSIENHKCNRCLYAKKCKAGCPVNSYLKHNDINFPDPVCNVC